LNREITIVNCGMGNIGSIENMLAKMGLKSNITDNVDLVNSANVLILPGVGSFDSMMKRLKETGLDEAIKDTVNSGAKLIGICLGAEVLLNSSEEGTLAGLGLISGSCKNLVTALQGRTERVPHVGWGNLKQARNSTFLYSDYTNHRVYFSHSYFLDVDNKEHIKFFVNYGIEIPAVIERGNIVGLQFHPERSNKTGLSILAEIVESA